MNLPNPSLYSHLRLAPPSPSTPPARRRRHPLVFWAHPDWRGRERECSVLQPKSMLYPLCAAAARDIYQHRQGTLKPDHGTASRYWAPNVGRVGADRHETGLVGGSPRCLSNLWVSVRECRPAW